MSSIGFVVLCGLPGAGKSTLCKKISHCSKSITFVHVNFDELLPRAVVKELIENATSDKGSWKDYRGYIKKLIARKVAEFVEKKNEEDLAKIPVELKKVFEEKWIINDRKKLIVLIDDNMYYRSMRYEYFQLARDYTISYGQIFFNCPVQKALERNAQRCPDEMVPNEVIETMSTRIEAPSLEEWEKHSFEINDDLENFSSLFEFFCKVLENTVEPVSEIDPEMQEQSRVACSESILYQTDQILRKLVTEHMTLVKGNLDKTRLKKEGVRVNAVRTSIISEMKKQQILFDIHIVENSTSAALKKCSPLYEFVQALFQSRL